MVDTATIARAQGRARPRVARVSTRCAATPPTSTGAGAAIDRTADTAASACGPWGLPARSTLSQDARGPSKPLEAVEAGATSTPWENVPAAELTVDTPATRDTATA